MFVPVGPPPKYVNTTRRRDRRCLTHTQCPAIQIHCKPILQDVRFLLSCPPLGAAASSIFTILNYVSFSLSSKKSIRFQLKRTIASSWKNPFHGGIPCFLCFLVLRDSEETTCTIDSRDAPSLTAMSVGSNLHELLGERKRCNKNASKQKNKCKIANFLQDENLEMNMSDEMEIYQMDWASRCM